MVHRHRKSSRCESLCACVQRHNSEQTTSCHSSKARHSTGSAPKWKPASAVSASELSGELELSQRDGAQPTAEKDAACTFGHGYPVGLDTAFRSSSIDSSLASNQMAAVILKASTFKNRIEDLT